ncbi:formyl peptide receptor-related sequence 7-like [Leptodactylus fuscus]|uniref:formyl peptide receptor-related sequence 7-like n=1 Tax=Leptodactylus fuscus TaxID=238119 RepID=UPI003F4E7A0D
MEGPRLYSDWLNASETESRRRHELYLLRTGVLRACITGVLVLVCLLGTIGNGLVIWFTVFRMKKTVKVVWFLSLAVADFSYAGFSPFEGLKIILGYWPVGGFLCKFVQFLLSLNLNVSVLQLTVISVDRCICVVFPVWCHNHRRPRLAYRVALTIWIVASTLAIPSVISIDVNNGEVCTMQGLFYMMLEVFLGFVVFFMVPLIIIIFCYVVILLHIRWRRLCAASKSYKTIVAVIVAFFICWFPYHLFLLLSFFGSEEISLYAVRYGNPMALVLVMMNSCMNPILYVFIGRDFKKNICGSFQATFEKALIEDEGEEGREKQEPCPALPMLHQDHKEEEEVVE